MIHTSSAPAGSCLGIDVSKASLEVCLLQLRPDHHRHRRRFANTPSGLEALRAWLRPLHPEPVAAVMESTGSYGQLAARLLHQAGHRVSVMSALRILQYARSCCRHNKTDQVDAEVIARFGLTHRNLPQWLPMPDAQARLRDLLRRKEEVACHLQAERNRRETLEPKNATLPSLLRVIRLLEKELGQLEKEIEALLQKDRALAQDCQRLEAIPGIGQSSARWLAAELPRTLESSRVAAAWAGVAPRLWESGTLKKRSRIGPAGNRYLRKALFFCAVSARRFNPRFKTFADRLAQRGLSKMAVVCAVLHKLLRTAFAILKNKSIYQPSHQSVVIPLTHPNSQLAKTVSTDL